MVSKYRLMERVDAPNSHTYKCIAESVDYADLLEFRLDYLICSSNPIELANRLSIVKVSV